MLAWPRRGLRRIERLTYENEWHQSDQPAPFTHASNSNSANSRLKDQLEEAEQDGRNRPDRFSRNTNMKRILQTTEDTTAGAVGECIPNSPPLDRAHHDHQQGGVERRYAVPARAVAGVREANSWYDGPAEGAAGEDEEGISFIAGFPGVKDRSGRRHSCFFRRRVRGGGRSKVKIVSIAEARNVKYQLFDLRSRGPKLEL